MQRAPVAAVVVEERMAALRALAAEKTRSHRSRFAGQELEAITLHTPAALAAKGRTAALTENFLPVEIDGQHDANRLLRVRVTGLTAEGDAGRLRSRCKALCSAEQLQPLLRKPSQCYTQGALVSRAGDAESTRRRH